MHTIAKLCSGFSASFPTATHYFPPSECSISLPPAPSFLLLFLPLSASDAAVKQVWFVIPSGVACYLAAHVVVIKLRGGRTIWGDGLGRGFEQTLHPPTPNPNPSPFNSTDIKYKDLLISPFLLLLRLSRHRIVIPWLIHNKDFIGWARLCVGQLYHFKDVMVRRGWGESWNPFGELKTKEASLQSAIPPYCLITVLQARLCFPPVNNTLTRTAAAWRCGFNYWFISRFVFF